MTQQPKPGSPLVFTARPWPAFRSLLRRPKLVLALLVLLVAGYGYAMLVPAVDMDDLAIATYQQGGEFLRQGRFTVWLLQALTGIMEYRRFWPELFASVCLALAGVLLSATFYTAARLPARSPGTLLLAGGLLLWPYHAEILMYSNQCGVGLGYLLCALALGFAAPYLAGTGRRGLPGAAGAAVLLTFALGLYESFAPVWLTLVFGLLLVQEAFSAPARRTPGQLLAAMARGLWPLAAALVLRAGVSAALCALLGVSGEDGTASKTIFWFRRDSLRDALVIPLREWLDNYLARAFGVPALSLLAIACVALVVWLVLRRRGVICGILLLLSQFSLGLLQGTGSQMARASQCFAVFVPLVAWLWLAAGLDAPRRPRPGGKSWLCYALAALLLLAEWASLGDIFRYNRDRWAYEEGILADTAEQLDAMDPDGSMPVVFTGEIQLSEALARRAVIAPGNPAYKAAYLVAAVLGGPQGELYHYENPQTLVINWAQTAFGSHEQMYLLMEEIGRPCVRPTAEQQAAGDALAGTVPEGSVSAQDGYLLVCF